MKFLEEFRTRLSMVLQLTDAAAATRGPVGSCRVALEGGKGRALAHRSGYWLLLDVPPGQRTVRWETDRYEDGRQSVNVEAPSRRAPIVQIPLTKPSPVSITLASVTRGHVGKPYQKLISTSGGKAPFKFSATGLPAGLHLAPDTGAIAGTPAAKGTSQITVSVTDNNATHDEKTYRLTIVA